jgi:hypothetical protein
MRAEGVPEFANREQEVVDRFQFDLDRLLCSCHRRKLQNSGDADVDKVVSSSIAAVKAT